MWLNRLGPINASLTILNETHIDFSSYSHYLMLDKQQDFNMKTMSIRLKYGKIHNTCKQINFTHIPSGWGKVT